MARSIEARSLYRALRRCIAKLPKAYEVEEGFEEVREAFEVHTHTFELWQEAMTEGSKKLAYLRMRTGGVGGAGRTVYVTDEEGGYEKQEVDEKSQVGAMDKAKYSNWHGGNMDPDAVKRHQRGLKRMGFKNHNGVYGDFGF